MDKKKEFVGRNRELEDFDKFLIGERPNWDGRGKGAPLLLVVGDEGMGKSALLRAMAERANNQKHYVIPREVDERKPDFREQIYPLIAMLNAMVRKKKPLPLQLVEEIDWFKVALAVFDKVAPGVKDLVNFLQDIRKNHQNAGSEDGSLALLFRSALLELDSLIGDDQRIVILIDPEKESPKALIPFLREISSPEMPRKVRFVIAQGPEDAVIKNAVEERELRELCAERMDLGKMNEKESLKFIKNYAPDCKLNEATREVFLERYGGWPLLMELGLDALQEVEGEITEEIIKDLPSDIKDFWDKRYKKVKEKDSRAFLQTVNLLPHPYLLDDVAEFATLEPDAMELVCSSDCPAWQLLREEDYDEIYSGEIWEDCPTHKHPTAKQYVVDLLKTKKNIKLYDKRLDAIVSHYTEKIGADFEDKDALVYILPHMIEARKWDNVGELLTNTNYLKKMQSQELQYIFQKYFIDLLNNQEIPTDKLVKILKGVLNAVCKQLETGKEKADWLDTFAYWINEFGPKDDALRAVAREFDNACGKVSEKLMKAYKEKGENDWALRFAELHTWVYQRAEEYEKCVKACQDAEEMCKGMKEGAYQDLGQAEFIRMCAHSLTKLSKKEREETKKKEYEAKAQETYKKLNDIFPAEEGESRWPTIKEWEELEELLETNTDKVLTPPSQRRSDEPNFKAKVVSNLHDCISAMHIIQFFEEHNGQVEWIYHENFEPEQFSSEDTLFTVLVGGPKSPGISKVADKFYEVAEERFLRMYSGLHFEAQCLKREEGRTHCYMLGGISKVNTLKAAYDFTEDAEVMQIIKSKI